MKSSKLLVHALFAGLTVSMLVMNPSNTMAADKNKTITVVSEKQVGKDGASTKFSYFNTSPESPDGKKIIYLRLKKEPIGLERSALVPGELWVCDRNLEGHHMITELKGMSSEDGALQQWLDNDHVALQDNGVIRVIDVRNGRDILKKVIETKFLGHDSFHGKVLFTIEKSQEKSDPPGIYELNCFTEEVKPVKLNVDCSNVSLPSFLGPEEVLPVENWRFLHCMYSPNGKKICFRLDVGRSERSQILGVCNIDGSDFKTQNKPLHQLWYDNESIMGHARFDDQGKSLPSEKKFLLMRWDLNGKCIETLGIKGCHLAASPARDCFASETMYNTNPVVFTLTPKGHPEDAIEIDRFDPYDITWNRFFHVNPSFSRDGKRIYYSKPLNDKYNGTFMCELKYK